MAAPVRGADPGGARSASPTPSGTAPASGSSRPRARPASTPRRWRRWRSDRAEARANAQAADKGKMTRAADLVNGEAAEAEEREPVGV